LASTPRAIKRKIQRGVKRFIEFDFDDGVDINYVKLEGAVAVI
jgi:hypothetical protein